MSEMWGPVGGELEILCLLWSRGSKRRTGGKSPQENPTVDANAEPQKEATSEKKVSVEPKKKKSNLGMVVGTLLILIGLSRILTAGTSISPTSFGGDFYTYTYQGIVAVSEILASIEVTLGWVIVSIGAVIDVLSMHR